nr:putative disease resistance protein At3g14460 [Ziziphus jujuba var. spinosa]
MAATLVGGAFLSATLQVLFDRMASREFVDYLRGKKFNHGLLKKLKIMLLSVNAVLNDAEEKQIRNQAVKEWLDELEDASYVADDLLDEIATDALQFKLEAGSRAGTSKVSNVVPTSLNSYNPDMETKIVEILERLEFIAKQKDLIGLKEGVGEKPSPRIPTTSLIEETVVYGRDGDKEAIIKLLVADDVGSNKVSVIPIVGMAGVGKTTLAQLVYNDEKVKEHFELKSCVCVTEEFDVFAITKTVLSAITSHSYENTDLDFLQIRLNEGLMGKKFLIVLDDVWNENYVNWENMFKPLKDGAQGSKILVTTRNESSAQIICTVPNHYLEHLKDEDCWKLFAKHAFDNGHRCACPSLETIGRKVVKKCKGLPLAAKTLGGLLRSRVDVGEWEKILESEIWDFSDNESNILPALRLSYHYLPSHLKRCFAFCSIFPKGYELEKHQLVLLWMAENLLQQPKRHKTMEEVGDEYFHELVSRSFFQRSSSSHESCFVMHGLVHDLAKYVYKEYCFTLEDGNLEEVGMKVRHLVVAPYVSFERFDSISEATHLRTLLPLSIFSFHYLSNEIMNHVILKLRCLRVLKFSGCKNLKQLPESIGELRHLRYLDLSGTPIARLPESVSMLYNLQTLDLSFCCNLTGLPKDMHQLINLRHLDISGSYKIKEMPEQISKLKNLQTLSTFIVGKDNGTKIGELRELSHLHGELSIMNLQNVVSAKDASEAKLMNKKYLEELWLCWNGDTNDSKHDRDVLDELLPHTNLKGLKIFGYGGTRFPNWLGDNFFGNIVSIELSGCKFCNSLPPLGQLPSLQSLHVVRLNGVVNVGAEFYGNSSSMIKPFISLETLHFHSMSAWEEWLSIEVEDGEVFPKLRELRITDCDRLITVDLPHNLPCLTKLILDGTKAFVSPLPRTPSLRKLKLVNCKKLQLQELPQTVESIEVGGCHGVISLTETLRRSRTPFLRSLHINNCPSSFIFPAGCLPSTLTELEIKKCEKLAFPFHHSLQTSIQRLVISDSCSSLDLFPLDFFSNLNGLYINKCDKLYSLRVSNGLDYSLTSLSHLFIHGCPDFECFPKGGLNAPSLTHLSIVACKNLKWLPQEMHTLLPSLQFLRICHCPLLEFHYETGLPSNLQKLMVRKCSTLVANRMKWNLQSHQSLTHFRIGDEDCVESFPEEGLLPVTLTCLEMDNFHVLKA